MCDMNETIESLRQQLTLIKSELKAINKAIDDPRTDLTMTMSEVIVEQKQQLADSQKREVMLRDALHAIAIEIATENLSAITVIKKCFRMADEALAATADLKGVILCHAKPVAWLHEKRPDADVITDAVKNVWSGVVVGKDAAYSIPLYRAPKGMK